MDENEFENSPQYSVPKPGRSPSSISMLNNTSPIPSQLKEQVKSHGPSNKNISSSVKNDINYSDGIPMGLSKEEASPSKVIDNKSVAVEKGGETRTLGQDRDRINNLAQKEKRLAEAGVTRKKAYQVISEALEAVITTEYRDAQGNVRYKQTPDFEKRKWAVEKALIMFGDAIERKEIEYDIGDSTLSRYKAMSVADMKARMADLILGKSVSRLPAIDVNTEGNK